MKKRTISALMAATMVLGSMTACGSSGASSEAASTNSTDTAASAAESATGEKEKVKLTIMFRDPGEGENVEVDLAPITASTGDYYSKIALNLSSADACPDIILEDSYQVAADVSAGYLTKLDDYLKDFDEWNNGYFIESMKASGQTADGSYYTVPLTVLQQGCLCRGWPAY